ncbi:MAG: hypothetical protein IT335_16195 [Thermomicrobiales bacterium]|nr:hypothetical protein [Thermomicrobiales bacterium]
MNIFERIRQLHDLREKSLRAAADADLQCVDLAFQAIAEFGEVEFYKQCGIDLRTATSYSRRGAEAAVRRRIQPVVTETQGNLFALTTTEAEALLNLYTMAQDGMSRAGDDPGNTAAIDVVRNQLRQGGYEVVCDDDGSPKYRLVRKEAR